MKILLVDDQARNLLALKVVLEDVEAELLTAESGNEALSLVAQHDLALILCDGDLCVREQVSVRAVEGRFEIARADAAREDPPAELDPLPGVRTGWLEEKLASCEANLA